MVSERVSRISVSPTMKVAAEAKRLKSEGINVIDLSVGEPDFQTPENVKQAAIKAINSNQTKYTINAGTVELRKAIAKKLKDDNDLDYSADEIIVSNGAKQSVHQVILAIVNKGDEVIIPAPYWVSYPEMVSMAEGENVFIDTSEETGFKLTAQQLENAITEKTKAIILCNPSNPTGSAYTENELKEIAKVIAKKNIYVISDEIYEKLIYGSFKFVSFGAIDKSLRDKVIIVNGVSKSHSMTGWRIGFTAGPLDVIKGVNKIQSHSTSNAASISQAAALEAYTGTQDALGIMRKEFENRRDYFYKEITSIKGISCYKPEGAFYLFPNMSAFLNRKTSNGEIKNSIDLAMYLLNEAKVAAVPGSAFGAEGFMRFSYATSMENLKEAAVRLKEALNKLK